MKVIGVDPAPKKHTTFFDPSDPSSEWSTVDAHVLPQTIEERLDSKDVLICWDSPLTIGGEGIGRYYERDIESFFRNHKEFTAPEGISVLPFAGCSHWAVTHATLGLPSTGSWSLPLTDLPFSFIESGDPPAGSGRFVVEVHPAVSLWLWCRERLPNGPWTYKKLKANRELIWRTFADIMPNKLPRREPRNDDEIDSYVAYLLGELWIAKQNVILLGNTHTGSFLVPKQSDIVQAFQQFVNSR